MSVLQKQHIRLDVYETEDLVSWTPHENICESVYLFEGPRRTRAGKYLCCGQGLYDCHGKVLIWDDASRLAEKPRVVDLAPTDGGVIVGQVTWYQTDDGRLWMFVRDESLSCRLGLTACFCLRARMSSCCRRMRISRSLSSLESRAMRKRSMRVAQSCARRKKTMSPLSGRRSEVGKNSSIMWSVP